MKFNQWTLALASAGMVSLSSIALADSHSVLSQVSKTTLSGYVDTSAIWSIGEGGNANFPGRVNDGGFGPGGSRVDGFNLNVVQISLESPLDESEWAAGYGVDMWMGPDSAWLGSSFTGTGDLALKQAYVALRAPIGNGLDIKMGQFDTIIGYEVGSSPANPNFSRSYGFFIEPFQHTGILASYQLTDSISVSAGVANTFGFGINDRTDFTGETGESSKTFMGAVSYEIPEEAGFLSGGALYAGVVDGNVFADADPHDRTNIYVGATIPTPVDGLAVGVAFDWADTSIAPAAAGAFPGTGAGGDAWTLAGYLSYQVSEKMTFNGRIDYAKGESGAFFVSDDGDETELLALTGTIDYSLWENVISRLEVRWDHSLEGGDAFGGANGGGFFAVPDEENAVTIAINAIYSF